ncbi:hypothetical protein BOX15_Mlig023578g5 [Macrostomum lignano]|uniref:Uncharacterized protein n=1 Tax=Macrostomum lignano TaxID=282301 RepID=A0A267DC42_9PLAT|nr:hypothetical protein BOX15_Mlig023578g5 [Macrostomum lignano]
MNCELFVQLCKVEQFREGLATSIEFSFGAVDCRFSVAMLHVSPMQSVLHHFDFFIFTRWAAHCVN